VDKLGSELNDRHMGEDQDTRRGPAAAGKRLIMAVGAILAALLIGGALLWNSGMVVAQLEFLDLDTRGATNGDTREFSVRVTVTNDGWTPIDVLDIGRHGPGLELVGVAGSPLPYTLEAGEARDHELVYRVTDCAAVPPVHWPVPVRLDRPWGEQTVFLDIPPVPQGPFAEGARQPEEERPNLLEWQHARSGEVCARQS
jgi:hypothetical protein